MKADVALSRPGRLRLIAARLLTILAVLVAFIGMLSFAVERTVLDESGVDRIATDLIQDDAIREQVALRAGSDLILQVHDLARLVRDDHKPLSDGHDISVSVGSIAD